jgi:hypothetical protein
MELDMTNNQTQRGVQTALGIDFPGCMQVKACAWGSGVLSRNKPLDVVRATRRRLGLNGVELRSRFASSPIHDLAEWREGEPQGLDSLTRQ